MIDQTNHASFYAQAKFYEVAFSFKNVTEENQTIIELALKISGKVPSSFLELAAGPASNSIEMAKRGFKSFAIDCSKEMFDYVTRKNLNLGGQFQYITADMKNFKLDQKVDCAAIFMNSTSYLLTNQDMISHLNSVSSCLNENGIYVMEMAHPRDLWDTTKTTQSQWSQTVDDVTVEVQWGDEKDFLDPIRQTKLVSALMRYKTPYKSGEILSQAEQRFFTKNEIDLLVAASDEFEIVSILGSLKPGIPFSNKKESWRMIPILKKKTK